MKVGRNDLCPCGSGKKFKKCHLGMPPLGFHPPNIPRPIPAAVTQQLQRHELEEKARRASYGDVRPIIRIPEYGNHSIVVVRNRLYYAEQGKWKFFTDFLLEYGFVRFGKDWVEQQKLLDARDQHPAFTWRRQAYDYMAKQTRRADGTYAVVSNGPLSAVLNFYYDLYIVDDNSLLDNAMLARLKHRDQFQGALHELFAEASCLRAGFTIIREDEQDRSRRHTEFMAVHKTTNQHILVEAKSRHRAGVMAMAGTRNTNPDIRFTSLINNATAKDPTNPLAIFVDTNLPFERANQFYQPVCRDPLVMSKAMQSIADKARKDHGGKDPYNILVFSNHPQHYSEDEKIAIGNHWAAIISRNPRVQTYREQALLDLFRAVNLYGNVPTLFPDER